MQLEVKKYLFDARQAAERIARFTAGKSLADYQSDPMLCYAVERGFSIIGEALAQIAKLDPAIVGKIDDYRRIIAFRNILIHAYAEVDDRLVWDIVESKLPALRNQIEDLLWKQDQHS